MPLLGHRNWLAVVDAAYPLQSRAGIRTIATGGDHLAVLDRCLSSIEVAPHVRPIVYLDAELSFLSDNDAPGVVAVSADLAERLATVPTHRIPHEQIIAKLDEAAVMFEVLVLKSTLTIPYTSVFIELDCGYWSESAERSLRQKIAVSR